MLLLFYYNLKYGCKDTAFFNTNKSIFAFFQLTHSGVNDDFHFIYFMDGIYLARSERITDAKVEINMLIQSPPIIFRPGWVFKRNSRIKTYNKKIKI